MWPLHSPMLISLLCFFLTLRLASSSSSSQLPSADVLYWPVTASEPSLLAQISYNSTSLKSDLTSYSPPSAVDAQASELVRIGLFASTVSGSKHWVGIVTSRSSLLGTEDYRPTLRLHVGLSHKDEVYHVTLIPSTSFAASSTLVRPQLELILNEAGPRPHLNQPVVVGPDGKNADQIIEKTFFQKYWWVFLIVAFLAMSGGGEAQ
ncbi:uncharacterized protein BO97DRAFT_342422 [Aspergillus homomorphus CBS 101889]|uniref:ER membrane protein complex subunit 10 n=1 Tax=Aspergillus homomorphus (strain CBS 101889) TaxID=1450537 RepID=A0A395I1V6_ASPHC|nr:hypothetical protein BO97DRAFT_342422 [Aspergillus homomorphus CBS 101889]RAL13623.1 hypothetical protein BO97DRAFT_342422 [Aspergillus homomorphus CBS 101889]